MRHRIVWLAAAAALMGMSAVVPAHALDCTVGVNAGVGIPSGDFGDFWKLGPIAGASFDVHLNDQWAVGVDGAWMKNDPSDDYQSLLDAISAEDQFTFIQYGAHGKWMLPVGEGPIAPYLVAGVSAYSLKEEYSEPGFSEDFTQSAFGFRGGAGAMWKLADVWGVGAEVDYHHVITDEDKIGHDSAPFIGIRGAVSYRIKGK